jgi:hypothetical protein
MTRDSHGNTTSGYLPRAAPLTRLVSLWRHMRRMEAEGHLPAARQVWELIWLKLRRGVGPADYLGAGLYRRELSWGRKLEFVGDRRYDRIIHSINPPEYDYVARDKLETYQILTAHGMPVPPVYGLVEGASGHRWEGETLRSHRDLLRVIQRVGIDTVCFKYVAGTRGLGFYKVKIQGTGDGAVAKIQPEGDELPLPEFWETLRGEKRFSGYFCQGVIDQHAELARLNPWSVNTVRSWMVRSEAGEWGMNVAVLRLGVRRSAVDNIKAGGIAARIDVESGRLYTAIGRHGGRTVHARHPGTDAPIEGTVLPGWSDVLALCKRTADLFPYYILLTVDVAFGKDGPLIVELGTTPDSMQIECDEGVHSLLHRLLKRAKRRSSA